MSNLPQIHTLWDYGNPAETEKKFRELLPQVIEQGEIAYQIELLTQIGRTYSLRMMFDEAHQILDEAQSMLTDGMIVPRLRYLLERGRSFNSAGKKSEAMSLFLEAMALGIEQQEDDLAIDAVHMVAIAEPDPLKQIEWNMKAIDMAEKTIDPRARGWLGSLLNNTGWSYFSLGEYDQALKLFEKSVTYEESRSNEKFVRIQKWCVARTYSALNRIDEALEMQHTLLKEYEDNQLEEEGYVAEELGELYLIKGDETTAKPYFKTAYDKLSQDQWLVKNEAERIERLKTLAGE